MDGPLVSVVISSYCRPAMLRDALISLRDQTGLEGTSYEVLVIDNDPAGGGQSVVEALRDGWNESVPLRYVHEERPGLSFARNRGIDESRGEVIAFLDDDMILDPGWLEAMAECVARTGADCVGGRTLVRWEGEPDSALLACQGRIAEADLGDEDFEMLGARTPGGGNAAFPRRVFTDEFRFSTDLGRVGTVLLSDEDTHLMVRLRRSGGRIWYCAGGIAHHRTGGERLTSQFYVRMHWWFGISQALSDGNIHGRVYQLLCALARTAKAASVYGPQWVLGMISWKPGERLVARCSLARQFGYVRGALGAPVLSRAASHEGNGENGKRSEKTRN